MGKVLVSAGCSFAWGQGLQDRNKKYASLISSLYGMTLIDAGIPGASNEQIATSGVWAINHALKKANSNDVVVIVGWTDQARVEYWDKILMSIRSAHTLPSIHPDMRVDILNSKNAIMFAKHNEIYKFVADNMWTPGYSYYKLLHGFNYINTYAKAKNVRIINIANIELYRTKLPPTAQVNILVAPNRYTEDIIDDEYSFKSLFVKGASFSELVGSNMKEYKVSYKDHHPNEKAHAVWAERIVNENKDILGT